MMDNIYRGEPISKEGFLSRLCNMKGDVEGDLLLEPLQADLVIEAAHKLSREINQGEIIEQLAGIGIQRWAAEEYVKAAVESLDKAAMVKKLQTELGESPFQWKMAAGGTYESYHPLGVIMHIGAGNTLGLSAFSVIEGLLTGNINILKLPENEAGLSSRLLMRLIELEPQLKPYIYVLDVSSKDSYIIGKLMQVADAVVVWGSDEAIRAIRQMAAPSMAVFEWGHRLSFAYFTKNAYEEKDLHGLAKDICMTDQLYCSSPQCVFFETDSPEELYSFALRFSKHLEQVAGEYPAAPRPLDIQAQITLTYELVRMEELLGEKQLVADAMKQYGIMIDYNSELKASPLFRNIWLMPVEREKLFSILRVHKGHLQTVGLSCKSEEFEELSGIFYGAGICRITACGHMSENYPGEAHDGIYALARYVKKVSRRFVDGRNI